MKNNSWKFESNQKLASKVNSSPATPNIFVKTDFFPQPTDSSVPAQEKSPQKRIRGKGVAMKMKAKIQEQLKTVQKQLQEREGELQGLTTEAESLQQTLRQRKRANEQLLNSEQMLQFKEKQLNNLMTIHAQLLEGAKKDIQNEKAIKFSHDEKIVGLKRRIAEFNSRAIERSHLIDAIEAFTHEKIRLEQQLKSKRETEARRKEVRSQAIRDLLQQLVKKNRRELEDDCEKKAKIVHQTSSSIKSNESLREVLQKKGLPPSEYYTFLQLKYVEELNFRINPQAQKVMRIFKKQVNPRIPQIIERFEEPEQFFRLKQQLVSLEKSKKEKNGQMKKKQSELARLEEQKSRLKSSIEELKAKTEIK